MSNEKLFYICGSILALSAVVVSLLGLKREDFPGKALPLVILWFAIFVGGATTFAVLHAQDEEQAEAAKTEQAGEEGEKGAGTTLRVEADATALAFNTTELEAQAGEVTIDFKNPSAIPHNVVIEEDGKELAGFDPIAEGEESETAELEPGTYTFLCTVPGHAAAGMEGTLVVK